MVYGSANAVYIYYTFAQGATAPAANYGDTNGDGSIDNKDYALLMQYLNGWSVTINLSVADTNVDGSVDNKDYALLMQYLNDWDVTLGPKS